MAKIVSQKREMPAPKTDAEVQSSPAVALFGIVLMALCVAGAVAMVWMAFTFKAS